MPRVRLTDKHLQSAKPPTSGRLELTDEATPGLEFRVTANGAKSWRVNYRVKGTSDLRRYTIGPYPSISLSDARKRARAIYDAAKSGIDLPAQERREAEEEARAARRPTSVSDLLDRYVEEYCKPNQRRWEQTEKLYLAHVKPTLGRKGLNEIRRADVVELLDDLQTKKGLNAQVNRVRSQIIAAFNWAVERDYLDANPASTVKKRKKIETPRSRVLDDEELAAIWRAADTLSYPSGPLVKMLILTGQRRDEVRALPRSELRGATWLLPAERNKAKRDHELPLPAAVVEILEALPQVGPYVFTCDPKGEKPYAGMKRLKEIVDRESKVQGWTFHDLRRTAATGLGRLGFSQDVIERVLNHSRPALAVTYNVHSYREEKFAALEAWARHVDSIVSRGPTNIVNFAERRNTR